MSDITKNSKLYDVLRKPLMTEKTTNQGSFNKFAFEVSTRSNKEMIKEAVESIFNVKVDSVRTLMQKGKRKVFRGRVGQQSNWKKAVVTLKEGHTLDVTAG